MKTPPETRTCRFCAKRILSAAVLCRHCGNLVVESDLETLARTWGNYSEEERRSIWEGLSVERQLSLQATLDYLTRQAPTAAPAPARRPATGRAADSVYNWSLAQATTSQNRSNSDIAWHALNTYG